MRPGTDDHAYWPSLAASQLDEVIDGRTRIGVVPAAEETQRHVSVLVVILLDVVAALLPVVVVVAVSHHVENPALDGREIAQH